MSEINPLLREEPIPDDNDRALRPKSLDEFIGQADCLLYTSPSPRDATLSRMPSSA